VKGPWREGSLAGDPEGYVEKWRLSLNRLNEEGLERGLLYWGPGVIKGRLRGRASLFMGAQLGNLEWACPSGTSRDG
jgi:hypothetical protein